MATFRGLTSEVKKISRPTRPLAKDAAPKVESESPFPWVARRIATYFPETEKNKQLN